MNDLNPKTPNATSNTHHIFDNFTSQDKNQHAHLYNAAPILTISSHKQSMNMEDSSYYQSKSTLSKPQFEESQYPYPQSSFESSNYVNNNNPRSKPQIQRKKNQVFLQGYIEEEELVRSKSLTDEDLEELKGCLDLGFGFSYDEIPELCNTLPALELCYSMSQKFLDEQQKSPESTETGSESSSPPPSGGKANWKISSPGDDPEDVKARLKFWAQTVACTVKLCS
ncbi:hypothetical protein SSX86_012807 [Deinandra increscens subsp. villosa]|uniref:Uncharacterized protein n=1 Tax=Deinandra increscens subsp. villosa TaxID=3103831 RepID=A0AAP0D9E7_9ASTR